MITSEPKRSEEGWSGIIRGHRTIVGKAVLDSREEARRILADAEERAGRILAEAETEASRALAEARAQVLDQAERDAAETVAGALRWGRAYQEASEASMIDAVLAVAERVWADLCVDGSRAAVLVAEELAQELSGRDPARLLVSPEDLEAIGSLTDIEVVVDSSLTSGDCVLEAGGLSLDARASVRAELALVALAEALGRKEIDGGRNAS